MTRDKQDENLRALSLARLSQEYSELTEDIRFAQQKKQDLEQSIQSLRERRLQISLEIVKARRELPAPDHFTSSGGSNHSDEPTKGGWSGNANLDRKIRQLEEMVDALNKQLDPDGD
jgi:chromosome segregation ATPase